MVNAYYNVPRHYTIPTGVVKTARSSVSFAGPLPGSAFTLAPTLPLVHARINGMSIDDDGATVAGAADDLVIDIDLPDGIQGFGARVVSLDAPSSLPVVHVASTGSQLHLPAAEFSSGHSYALEIGIDDPKTGWGSQTATGSFAIGN